MSDASGPKVSESSFCPVAVTGLSVFCPEANGLRELWQLIVSGRHVFSSDPHARWKPEPYFRADRWDSNGIYATAGGFLQGRFFNPLEWRIPPATLASIDPVHLLAMQLAAEALQDAGVETTDFPRERTAVIFAASGGELGLRHAFQTLSREYVSQLDCLGDADRERVLEEWDRRLPRWTEDSFAGYLSNVLTGRIANRFGLGGTSYVVDAACASSLAAVQAGVQQLQLGAADAAVVGAADASNHPFCYMSFARSQALSPKGTSRPFDQQADGIVLGEGMAVMVLRRLDDALVAGHPIHAVIRGIGSSSDGCGRSVTAPDLDGQRRCLESAYRHACCDPRSVSLIEAHGTGTALGDSVELQSLLSWLGPGAPARSVALGSIKSQIGHCKAAAGMLGLAKGILALESQVLPPTSKVEQPREPLATAECPLYLNTDPRPWWSVSGHPRRAGVSAFGFGGSNFHVVLEESPLPSRDQEPWALRPAEIFCWSRDNRTDLQQTLRDFLESTSSIEPADFTAWAGALHQSELDESPAPQHRNARAAIVASSPAELRERLTLTLEQLKQLPDRQEWTHNGAFLSLAVAIDPRQVCFLYPGQGTPAVGMFRDLVMADREVRPFLETFDDVFHQRHPDSVRLVDRIWPPPACGEADRLAQHQALSATASAQPALGAIAVALTVWLRRFGIVPAGTAGHSYGEFAALWAAGALSLSDLTRLSVERGALCAAASAAHPGAMIAIELGAEQVQTLLDRFGTGMTIANLNAPEQTVCAGPVQACKQFLERMKEQGVVGRRLSVSGAFHTDLMRIVADDWERLLADTSFQRPNIPVYSNTTGRMHAEEMATLRGTLTQHLYSRVDFVSEVHAMLADHFRVFIEVGPGTVMSSLVRRIATDQPATLLNFGSAGPESLQPAALLLARCFVLGLPVDLSPWFRGRVASMTIAGLLEQLHERKRVHEKSWWISPTGVRPPAGKRQPHGVPAARVVSPNPEIVEPKGSPLAANKPSPSDPPPSHLPHRQPARPGAFPTRNRDPQPTPLPKANETVSQLRSEHDHDPPWNPFLNLAQRWFDLQSQQQTVADRIFRLQELMLTGHLPSADRQRIPQITPEPMTSQTPPSAPLVRSGTVNGYSGSLKSPPPAPIAGVPQDYEFRVAQTSARGVANSPSPDRPAVVERRTMDIAPQPVVAKLAEPTSGVPPTVAAFREHLLTVVSDRTGYEREILDESLPLEAGLGIDSIKVVEILSKMQDFYAQVRMEGATDESVLQEFVNLKSLSDIVGGYERARQRFLELGRKAPAAIDASPVLEHYAVVAESAEPGPGAPAKN